jgi:hypothetical protein
VTTRCYLSCRGVALRCVFQTVEVAETISITQRAWNIRQDEALAIQIVDNLIHPFRLGVERLEKA